MQRILSVMHSSLLRGALSQGQQICHVSSDAEQAAYSVAYRALH